MKTLQAVTALQLASLSLAKPLLGLEHLKSLVARENPEGMTWEDMCNQWKLDDDDASIAQQLWYNTGTGAWFDEWLLAHEDRKFWTATMDGEVNNNGQSGFSCATLDSACNPPADCKFHFDQGMGNAYWVLFAASRLHDGLSYVWDTLHSTTMYNALQLPTMIEKFGEEPAQDINALSIIGSSLVVASGFMGAMPAVSAVSTMLIGAFGLASQFSNLPPPDPTAKVSEQLSTAFNNAASSIETMVSVIYGGDTDVPTTSLPGQTGNFQTALARFFADGKFLVQDAESFDSAGTSLRDKWIYYQQVQIAGFLMKAYGYVVAVDKTVDNPDGCRSMHSSWWDGTLNKCFYTVKKTDGQAGGATLMAEDAPFVVAKDEYHLDVGEFYSIAYHCAKAHPDGNGAVNPDIYQHPTDGSKPECFYNNGVIVADFIWEDNGVVHSQNVDINTGGVVENPAAPNYPDQRPPTPE